MEEIKLWAINGSQVEDLKPTSGMKSEKFLEDTLVENPDLLMEDLTLVGRQTPTEGGRLDLLGVDGNGRLVVFELKRGMLSWDAVAQVIDYASDLNRMDLDMLANHISQRSGNLGIEKIENFQTWYEQNFEELELESLKPLRMFLVGLGVDDRTERMVKFLAENSNLDISLLTFYGFMYDGKTILAKRVEVDGANIPSPKSKKPSLSREERLKRLIDRAESFGVSDTFSDIKDLFLKSWKGVSERITVNYFSMHLRVASGKFWMYARVIPEISRMRIVFYPWGTDNLPGDTLKSVKEEIAYETRTRSDYNGDETHILISPDEWVTHKERISKLMQSIYKSWQDYDAGQ